MKFEEFIHRTAGLPVIESELLCAGIPDPRALKVQLSRWEKAGKIIQLKRGMYILAKAYRKIEVYEPYVAGILKKPSFISLEKALEFHGLIPEATFVYTSVTTKRPARFETEIGTFDFRHIKTDLFWGYESVTLHRQTAFFASAEKALLDFFYLRHRHISVAYLDEMRLQNLEKIDRQKLLAAARRFQSPSMTRAAHVVEVYIESQCRREKTA
jgi:predicted transcriptional regulator of viral defense system